MNMKCIIVDDEPLARKVIADHLVGFDDFEVLQELSNGIDAHSYIVQNEVDVIFLDINMPRMSGIELIKNLDVRPMIILTTAHPDFAVDAFELEVFDYLLKPISMQRFTKTILKLRTELLKLIDTNKPTDRTNEWISIKEGKRLYKIKIDDIYLIQAYGDYVRVFSNEKTYITKSKFQEFIADLPSQFIQVHRSNSVNADLVNYIEGNHAMIKGEKVPISASYKQQLIDRMDG